MTRMPVTIEGHAKMQEELNDLINRQRPEIIEAIAEARSHGDLSENAEYQYAKEQQSLIEGKIIDLENKIAQADIIDVNKLSGKEIKFGAKIKIQEDETSKEFTYQIVGEYESDIENKMLSISSPLARALIGKKKGDVIEFISPKGAKIYNVISVKFK